jgi:hypothetical protein
MSAGGGVCPDDTTLCETKDNSGLTFLHKEKIKKQRVHYPLLFLSHIL